MEQPHHLLTTGKKKRAAQVKSKSPSISRGKYFLIAGIGLFWTIGILIFYPVGKVLQPILPLPSKVTLYSYPTYMLTSGGLVMLLGVLLVNILLLFSWKKDKKLFGSIFNYSVVLGVIICIFSAIPRYYLEKKIDNAQYILCAAEHHSSAKVSWDVYAESEDLCRSKQ
ncbi:hypothetical protein [Halodesulfovibrio aestuarii]|uniref:hypothetical protein n=1 Tax=Halodesulfovibrio aestuarii TaxID=126333 RepID=UPI0012B673E4